MKKTSCFLIILIIVLFISAFNISKAVKAGKMPLGAKVSSYITKPFISVGSYINSGATSFLSYFGNKKSIVNENRRLKEENIRLKAENEALKGIAYKEEEIEKLLNFKEKLKFNHKGARILSYSPTHWYKIATIDLGSKDDIKPGLGVVGEDGFIGQVSEVSQHTSTIESVTGENTAIGGRTPRSGVKGLVIGDGSDNLIFTYLKLGVDIKIGDVVNTYGDGSLIPSGIPIGEITEVKEDKLTNSTVASIKPFSDFNKSDNVFVIISNEKIPIDKEISSSSMSSNKDDTKNTTIKKTERKAKEIEALTNEEDL